MSLSQRSLIPEEVIPEFKYPKGGYPRGYIYQIKLTIPEEATYSRPSYSRKYFPKYH